MPFAPSAPRDVTTTRLRWTALSCGAWSVPSTKFLMPLPMGARRVPAQQLRFLVTHSALKRRSALRASSMTCETSDYRANSCCNYPFVRSKSLNARVAYASLVPPVGTVARVVYHAPAARDRALQAIFALPGLCRRRKRCADPLPIIALRARRRHCLCQGGATAHH